MAYLSEHGGECCGIRHIHDFTDSVAREHVRVDELVEAAWRVNVGMIEAVLRNLSPPGPGDGPLEPTEQQNTYYGPMLKSIGFKVVKRFKNPNTGNMLYVYHLYKDSPKKRAKE